MYTENNSYVDKLKTTEIVSKCSGVFTISVIFHALTPPPSVMDFAIANTCDDIEHV